MYPFLENLDWRTVFLLPSKIIKEPYFQSFQYKILNRILNCNDKLYTWKLIDSNLCKYCKQVDTIEHHLFECPASQKIWEQLENWIYMNLECTFPLTICEVIFGIAIKNNIDIDIIHFMVLINKWYINKAKTDEQPLYFWSLLNIVRDKIRIIVYINRKNEVSNVD